MCKRKERILFVLRCLFVGEFNESTYLLPVGVRKLIDYVEVVCFVFKLILVFFLAAPK